MMTQPTYDLDFGRYNEHFVDVRLCFVAKTDTPTIWLPTWIAGSYLVREFAKNISAVHYQLADGVGATKRAKKVNKNTWILDDIKAGDTVAVHYDVYCYDTSVRTAYIDHRRIFANFSSLLLMLTGSETALGQINLCIPQQFFEQNGGSVLACGLKHQEIRHQDRVCYQLETVAMFDAYDYPFEIGVQDVFSFDINTPDGKVVPHRFFVSGVHFANLDRLKQDVRQICQAYVDWLGWTPFSDYTFLTYASGNDYGGLEHINSTALVTPRDDLPKFDEPDLPSDDYQRFLGLCSHEYFHAWWVKSVRPDVMMTSTLQSEAYTLLLWVFEGFTSYLDDLMLYRSGVIDKNSYLKLIAAQITRYQNTHGRHKQTLFESSFDAWIKLYRPDENSPNSTVSYYNKGALAALVLDLLLMKHAGGRLFDVVKDFTDKAYHADDKRFGLCDDGIYQNILARLPQAAAQAFFADVIGGVGDLDLANLLSEQGVDLVQKSQTKAWGLTLANDPLGQKITHIEPNSTAAKAGLSAGDVIVAIDHIKANADFIRQRVNKQAQFLEQGRSDVVLCHAFRRDGLMCVELDGKGVQAYRYSHHLLANQPNLWLDGIDNAP